MDSVLDCTEPEFRWEKLFGHIVACDIAYVFLIAFAQSVLALSPAGDARDLRVGFEELVDGLTDETEVSIGNHFFWKFANDADDFFHLE